MAGDPSSNEPLLLNKEGSTNTAQATTFLAKWIIKVALWLIFITWATFIFLFPSDFVSDLYRKWIRATEGTLFGITGSTFLIFSAPILLLAILAIPYLALSGEREVLHGKKNSRLYARYRLWTFPVVVEGPFGVVSAAEMIGIGLFVIYVVWAFCAETVTNIQLLSWFHLPSKEKSVLML
ncbi:hypothetical protein ABTG41_05180, partial [Acinetobacter baumannii]